MQQNGEREKRRAHELIERLAPHQTSALVDLLEVMLDPVSQALPMLQSMMSPRVKKSAGQWRNRRNGSSNMAAGVYLMTKEFLNLALPKRPSAFPIESNVRENNRMVRRCPR
jgi:hypothetical protein